MKYYPTTMLAMTLGSMVMNGAPGKTVVMPSLAQGIIDEAHKLFVAKNYPEAEAAYRKAVVKDPSHTGAWRDLGWCLLHMKQEDEAIAIWTNLLKVNPGDCPTLNALGGVYLSRSEFAQAATYFKRSIEKDPSQSSIHVRLGEALEDEGNWEGASRSYEAALKLNPGSADVLLRCARADEKLGGEMRAIRRLETAIRKVRGLRAPLASRLAHLYGSIGDEAYRTADYEKARSSFEEGLKWEPENIHLLTSLGWTLRKKGDVVQATACWKKAAANSTSTSVNVLRALGEANLELGELAEARHMLERAHTLAPAEPSPCFQLADIGLRQKDVALLESAIGFLVNIPGLDEVWADRSADLFIRYGSIDQGLAAFSKAPVTNRFRNRALSRLHASQAVAALQADHLDEAIRLGGQAIEENPRNRAMLRDLGWMYARKGDWEKAYGTWNQFVKMYPELAESHSLLAEAMLNRQDPKGAKTEAERALTLDPDLRAAKIRLLRACSKSGMLVEALSLAEKLIVEYPSDLSVQYHYAELLTRSSEHAKAKVVWQRIREQEPNKLRPTINWLRESYAAEDYDLALAEASKMAQTRPAPESILLFLTQDAQILEDHERVVTYFRRLTEDYPEKNEYWVSLVRELSLLLRYQEALDTADLGLKKLPASLDLRILRSEMLLFLGRSREALDGFRKLTEENSGNATVFNGMIDSLISTRHYTEAIERLESNRFDSFSSEFETMLRKASSYRGSRKFDSALDMFERLVHPQDGSRYVPILLYHGIMNQKRSVGISAANFEKHLSALIKAGYNTITLTEMEQMIAGKLAWPVNPVLITFDDARTDSFREADPILAKLGAKATMFVPTADSAPDADQYHASWTTIRRLAATGRWDMQAHGFEAHHPIAVNAEGHTGRFLNERAWLEEFKRQETDEEFRNRVNQDYQTCLEMLVEKIPGIHPLAYAFPYNEAGQIGAGSMQRAGAINAETWPKYFRFGMVQDPRGYNSIKPFEKEHRLFWRYEPGREWSGEELLQRMARNHPQNAARLQLALLRLWQGYHQKSRKMVESLTQEVPALRPECELALAEVAWMEDRPRKAREHLEAAKADRAIRQRENAPRLERYLAWANNPVISMEGDLLDGSDDRSVLHEGIGFKLPFRAPIDTELHLDSSRIGEKGLPDIKGRSAEGRLSWAPTSNFDTTMWARYTDFEGLKKRRFAGINLHFGFDLNEFKLGAARERIETVSAIKAGLGCWAYTFDYQFHFANWSMRASANVDDISDQNRITIGNTKILYQLQGHADWRFGLSAEKADSREHSQQYYTPMDFSALQGFGEYAHRFEGGSSLLVNASYGHCNDAINHKRWTGAMTLSWVQKLAEHLRMNMDLGAGTSKGYSFRKAALQIQWRF